MPFVPTYSSYSGTDLIQKNEKCSVLKDFLSVKKDIAAMYHTKAFQIWIQHQYGTGHTEIKC